MATIEDFASLVPESLMDKSGAVFYSGRAAFGSSCKLYILGLNPGGSPEEHSQNTVRTQTNNALRCVCDRWSSYVDESWGTKGASPGEAPMQKGVVHLLGKLGLDPRTTPASNLVFLRSKRVKDIPRDQWNSLVTDCWPFHLAVINELNVRVVVCLGKPSSVVARSLLRAMDTPIDSFMEQNKRGWENCTYRNSDGLSIVQLTHPSRADWTSRATDPTELVMRALDWASANPS